MNKKRIGSEQAPRIPNTSRAQFQSIQDLTVRAEEITTILKSFAMKLTHAEDTAEDLVQDAYVRALENKDKFQDGTSLLSWMFRIVQNIHIDKMRAQKVRKWIQEPFDVTDVEAEYSIPGIPAHQEAHIELVELEKMIQKLSPEHQELIPFIAAEMEYKEIAQALRIPVGTVMSRLARLRDILRNLRDSSH